MLYEILLESQIAGLLASLACGLGALPLIFQKFQSKKSTALGYGFAGGLMFSASVYNLILPGLTMGGNAPSQQIFFVLVGIILGATFLSLTEKHLETHVSSNDWKDWGGRKGLIIFIAMAIHSIPEGVAVGVGFTSGEIHSSSVGTYIALAIAIHNIPEGLAVAIPLRLAGASINKCFWAAFLTSLPQPLAAIPAVFLSWFFQPLIPLFMGFAAGAMIFLVLMEMIPEALDEESPQHIAWAFTWGFSLMLLVQVVL